MVYFGIFCFELVFLFFLSQEVTKSCSRVFYFLTRSEKWTISLLALLFFPGTFLHETAHYFAAMFLLVPVGHMEFIPKLHEGGVKLGSVSIGKTDPFRRAIIGLAPLFVGLTCLFLAVFYFSKFPFVWYINIVLILFIVFEISNTMFSSKRDIEGLPALVFVVGIFVLAGWVLGVRLPEGVIEYFSSNTVQTFFYQVSVSLLFPLGIDGGILLLAKLLQKKH